MYFSDSLSQQLKQQIKLFDLPESFLHSVQKTILPLAEYIRQQSESLGRCSLISINGSQGSGKSTMTIFLRLILQQHFNLKTVAVSIDDFYLTLAQRQQLSLLVHPLLATRGVPGTHDLELAVNTLQCLQQCSAQSPCSIPVFDKSIDDRADEALWPMVDEAVDVILFEGWCNHAPAQSDAELVAPINDLEKFEDSDAQWRRFVNQQLLEYNRRLFSQADGLVFMQIPSFEKVYEWRGLQEHKLKKTADESSQGVMDQQQLIRFIQHYERITRSCLEGLPDIADIILKIDNEHRIESMQIVGSSS